jgi:hypothetical protein
VTLIADGSSYPVASIRETTAWIGGSASFKGSCTGFVPAAARHSDRIDGLHCTLFVLMRNSTHTGLRPSQARGHARRPATNR